MGSGGGGVSVPSMTAEERALLQQQTDLLKFQQTELQRQLREQNLLQPLLYSELGLTPTYGNDTSGLAALDQKIAALEATYAGLPRAAPQLPSGDDEGGGGLGRLLRSRVGVSPDTGTLVPLDLRRAESLEQQIASLRAQRDSLSANPAQVITGFTRTPEAEARIAREQRLADLSLQELELQASLAPTRAENERLLLERSGAALRGELPADPGLLRSLDDQEQRLRDMLFQQLGPGFETSTPGIEALAEFNKRKTEIVAAASRADLTLGEQLSEARAAGTFGRGTGNVSLGETLRGSRLQDVFATSSFPSSTLSGLSGTAQGLSGPLSMFQNLRNQELQSLVANAQSRQASSAGLGQLFGTVLTAAAIYFGGASDRRFKRDIKRLGTHALGFGIYLFRYLWDDTWRSGAMADEVAAVRPDAVSYDADGYGYVNYAVL